MALRSRSRHRCVTRAGFRLIWAKRAKRKRLGVSERRTNGMGAGQQPRRDEGQEQSPLAAVLARPIVLVGMMGAGKTAVGTQLARLLQVPFLDSDEELERAAQMTVAEIFARDGEPFFRARESEVLARLMAGPAAVISTGGGAFISEANRSIINERGVSIWLKADIDLLWQRVRQNSARPLLRTADPKGTLAALLATREPIYGLAQVAVAAEAGLGIEMMAQKVVAELRKMPSVFK